MEEHKKRMMILEEELACKQLETRIKRVELEIKEKQLAAIIE